MYNIPWNVVYAGGCLNLLSSIEAVGYIKNEYVDKFGIPRQSGLVENGNSVIVFHEKFRDENAVRGLEEFSHIWLLWLCDKAGNDRKFYPTVRPPRLGGNKRLGVFATRSPFHPNRIGMSCVRLVAVEKTKEYGVVLRVSGEDLLCGTPILDIKPYLPFSDSFPNARAGFAERVFGKKLEVEFVNGTNEFLPERVKKVLCEILSQDPRPAYQNERERTYKMDYGEFNVSFSVKDGTLYVLSAKKTKTEEDR